MAARRLRSRPDPNAPTHHDRDVVASRRSASRVACGFPSGAQGSGPPTHLHASCDNAYALTVRIRSKLTLPPIVSSSTEARCRRRPLVSSTGSPLLRISDLFTSLYRAAREYGAGLSRRLFFNLAHHIFVYMRPSVHAVQLHSRFPCAGSPTVHLLQMHISRDLRDRTMSVTLTAACSESAPGRPLHPAPDVFHANQAPPPPKADIHLQTDRV